MKSGSNDRSETQDYRDKQQALFSPESSKLYSSTRSEAKYEFDYEINSVEFKTENGKETMYMKSTNRMFGDKYSPIDLDTFYDTLDFKYSGDEKLLNNKGDAKLAKANIFKRLVSKKKKKIAN